MGFVLWSVVVSWWGGRRSKQFRDRQTSGRGNVLRPRWCLKDHSVNFFRKWNNFQRRLVSWQNLIEFSQIITNNHCRFVDCSYLNLSIASLLLLYAADDDCLWMSVWERMCLCGGPSLAIWASLPLHCIPKSNVPTTFLVSSGRFGG